MVVSVVVMLVGLLVADGRLPRRKRKEEEGSWSARLVLPYTCFFSLPVLGMCVYVD